jgi:hypothetical protein
MSSKAVVNEVELSVGDLNNLIDMLSKADDSAGYVSGVFRFVTNNETDAAFTVSFDEDRGEHVVSVEVFAVFDD